MLAVVQLLALVLAYWAFRLITKKRLRDLKIRWSLVVFVIGLAPAAYYFFGWLEKNLFGEIYPGHASMAMLTGAMFTAFFTPALFISALFQYLRERKRRTS
jgi:hypothetical protein